MTVWFDIGIITHSSDNNDANLKNPIIAKYRIIVNLLQKRYCVGYMQKHCDVVWLIHFVQRMEEKTFKWLYLKDVSIFQEEQIYKKN